MTKEIIWLGQVNGRDRQLVGGKGLALGTLSQLKGLRVPAGFVITTELYGSAGKPTITPEFETRLIANFKKIGSQFVAVRSSATAEDGQDSSLAGLFETWLYVDQSNLLEAVRKCWASVHNQRVKSYLGIKISTIRMAVVVQAMIPGEISGVLFTANPMTGQNQILIESIYGLGEPLVQGKITPDNFVVRKTIGQVVSHRPHQQSVQLKYSQGALKLIKLNSRQQHTATLNPKLISRLIGLAKIIEQHYKKPQDIEWTYANGKFYIIQARPITALPPPSQPKWHHAWLRGGSLLEESLAIIAQSEIIKQEVGAAYETIITVKHRGGWVPEPDEVKMQTDLEKLKPGLHYVKATQRLEKKLQTMLAQVEIPFETVFGLMAEHLAYYGLAKQTTEALYNNPKTSSTRKTFIEKWRNQPDHFTSYDELWKIIAAKTGLSITDLNFLTVDELKQALRSRKDPLGLIKPRRKAVWSLVRKNGRTRVFLKNLSPTGAVEPPPAIIRGQVAFGTGKIIRGVVGRDIIVVVMTGPDDVKLVKRAKAIITDEGGILSHAAIMCRELKTPCVIGTKNGTKLLRPGDRAEIDMATGSVSRLSQEH